MKKILLTLAAASATLMAGDFYVGASGQANQVFLSGDRDWLGTGAGNQTGYGYGAQFGADIAEFGPVSTGLEARLSRADVDGVDTDTFSMLAKAGYDCGFVTTYVLGGYSSVNAEADTVDGFTWGGGVSKPVTGNVVAFVDYTVLPDDGIIGNEVITVGVNYKF